MLRNMLYIQSTCNQYLWGLSEATKNVPQACPTKGQEEWSIHPPTPMPAVCRLPGPPAPNPHSRSLPRPQALTSLLELTSDWLWKKAQGCKAETKWLCLIWDPVHEATCHPCAEGMRHGAQQACQVLPLDRFVKD